MAIAAVSAICLTTEVNAQTNDMRNGGVVDGLEHHFKGDAVRQKVCNQIKEIVNVSNVDGVALSKVYSDVGRVVSVGSTHDKFNGLDYNSPELHNEHSNPTWCHHKHVLYNRHLSWVDHFHHWMHHVF